MKPNEVVRVAEKRLTPDQLKICKDILSFLSGEPEQKMKMLTYVSLHRVSGKPNPDDFMAVLRFLTGASARVLDIAHAFIDDDDTYHEVSPETMISVLKTKVFHHPDTGDEVPDYEDKVVEYFTVSQDYKGGDRS